MTSPQSANPDLEAARPGMKKAVQMDHYLNGKRITASGIGEIVKSLFGFDLEHTPVLPNVAKSLPNAAETSLKAFDFCLEQCSEELTGANIRKMINRLFGINLDAISALEGAGISLFSKECWVLQQENDLFVIQTGTGDLDVKVSATAYFTEQTGIEGLPEELQQSLTGIGYACDEQAGTLYFSNPAGEAVPDAFKGQTIKTIIETIQKSYAALL